LAGSVAAAAVSRAALKLRPDRPDSCSMDAESRRERIVVETERYSIVGDVTLPAEGFHSRLSDLLNREGVHFIPLSDATITGRNGEPPQRRSFIAVARDHVQVAYEASEG
jgi:hypothetical protein